MNTIKTQTGDPHRSVISHITDSIQSLSTFERIVYAVVALWILTMISLPIARWIWGESAMPAGISISVLVQVSAVMVILVHGWGIGRTALVTALCITLAWAVEYIGSTTGFPFGAYAYTDTLHPQLGHVPLLIPLAWMMMLPSSWALAYRITGGRNRLAFVLVSALAFTAWDFFLDPQMVGWNLWAWESPGVFSLFNIPLSNYAGWLLASALITALVLPLMRPEWLPQRPLLILYTITWIFEAIGLFFFWGMPGPAVVGFLTMGAMLLWGLKTK